MGTNYYAIYNRCDHCGRYDEAHIGKSMNCAQVYPGGLPNHGTAIRSVADWRDFVAQPGVTVVDEYQREHDGPELMGLWRGRFETEDEWDSWLHKRGGSRESVIKYGDHLDPEGYHVTPSEFS